MEGQDEQGLVIVGSDGTEHEFPHGMDPQKAAGIVREQEAFAKSGPLVRSRTGQMYRHPSEPVSKDFVDGALSAVNPMNYVKAAESAYHDPAGAVGGVLAAPFRLAGGLITEPARTLGSMTAGEAVGAALPLAVPAGVRTVGKGLEVAGTKAEWPMQVAASHQVLSGNLGGLGVLAVPPALRWAGRSLQKLGGADLETAIPSGTRNIDVKGPIRTYGPAAVADAPQGGIRVPYGAQEPAPYRAAAKAGVKADEAAAAKVAAQEANDARLAQIDDAVEGLNGTRPVIKVSTKAKMADGSHASMSQGFEAPKPNLEDRINDAVANGQLRRKPEGPPAIRVTGKAATDLANGTVPVASKAPMPSETRMDELAGKLGGQPPTPLPPAKVPVLPGGSRSKGPMSLTPGYTIADLEEVGLPNAVYKSLPPEILSKIQANRASRHMTNYSNAVTDKGLRSILEESLLMRNMDRLR